MSCTMENKRAKKKQNDEIKARLKNMSKEAIQIAIAKKKACNARALEIVQQLIDPNVKEQWLLENLKHINQCHFQDIVEERAITMCCGYPLCDKELSNIPKKLYKISTKENKVYDITDRKNYCSNFCYKASAFLKDQLYTSPLWLRDCELPVQYRILSSKLAGASGSGAEIDLGNTSPVKVTNKKPETDHQETNNTINEINVPLVKNESLKNESPATNVSSEKPPAEKTNKENTVEETEIKIIKGKSKQSDEQRRKVRSLPQQMKRKEADNKPPEDIVVELEKKVKSWFTIDTLMFLLGEEGVKELLKLNGNSLEQIESLRNKDVQMYERYQELFKRLNLLELKEKAQEDKELPSKPLPDYHQLQEEAKKLELKVRSFFRGDDRVTFMEEVESKNDEENMTEERFVSLPLIDHHDIILTRRRILLEKLDRVLPDILAALELSMVRLGSELKQLVATFRLGPSNICLKTSQWSLACLIIIKLLTLRNEILKFAYTKQLTQKRMMTFLLAYDLDGGYIDRLISYLIDVEHIGTIEAF